jgi:hypothetical protein
LALLLLAAAAAVAQLLSLLAHAGYRPISLLAIWRNLHEPSLQNLRDGVTAGPVPALWTPLAWLLEAPAWLVAGLLGGLLLLTGRRRRRPFD